MRKFGAAVGHSSKISCLVHSNPPPAAFYWMDKTGANISESSSYSYGIMSTGNSSILTLPSVRQSDYGNFTCVASNTIGMSRYQLSLLPPGE